MNKKTNKIINEILNQCSVLYTDWVPTDGGRLHKVVDENKKDLLLAALLNLALRVSDLKDEK
jgi:hypothetical protein